MQRLEHPKNKDGQADKPGKKDHQKSQSTNVDDIQGSRIMPNGVPVPMKLHAVDKNASRCIQHQEDTKLNRHFVLRNTSILADENIIAALAAVFNKQKFCIQKGLLGNVELGMYLVTFERPP